MSNTTKNCKILLVDDVEINLVILSEILKTMDLIPLTATRVKDAIDILEHETPNLILLDVSMPEMNGLEFCSMLKNDVYTRDIPVIFISALDSTEDLSKAFEVGAVDYISKPFEASNVKMRVTTHLKLYNMQCELEDANRKLNTILKKSVSVNRSKQQEIYKSIAELGEEKDSLRTYGRLKEHEMVRLLTRAMMFSEKYEDQITEAFVEDMEVASTCHDLGMIRIPDEISLKPTKLSEDEMEIVKLHTTRMADKVKNILEKYDDDASFDTILMDVICYHHENYDGTGYPKNLKGEEIPLAARIMRIIDVYEALVNDRCYHKAISHEEALEVVKDHAGSWFDPGIVEVFTKINKKFV